MPSNVVLNENNIGEGSTTVVINGTTYIARNINPQTDEIEIEAMDENGATRGRVLKKKGMSGTMTLEQYTTASAIPELGAYFIAAANYFGSGSAYTSSLVKIAAPRAINEIWTVECSFKNKTV